LTRRLTYQERVTLSLLVAERRRQLEDAVNRARWEKAGGPKGGNLRRERDKRR
jgi:hypothetical protein